MNETIETLSLVVQALLAVFALAYTIETRNLRKHSSSQLKVLERQHTVAVAPYLLVGLSPKAELIKDLKENPSKILEFPPEEIEAEAKNKIELLEEGDSNFYLCQITNPTSKIALDIEAIIYDSNTKNFTLSDEGLIAIGEKESELVSAEIGPLTDKEVIKATKEAYPDIGNEIDSLITYEDSSYIFLIFKDIEQGLYGIKREFSVGEDGECSLYDNRLIVF